MVNPVKGPFVTEYGRGNLEMWFQRVSRTQAKPFTKRLPFSYDQEKQVSFSPFTDYPLPPPTLPLGWGGPGESAATSSAMAQAHAKAFKRFTGKLGDTASLGITFAQRQMALDMISDRANSLRTLFFGNHKLRTAAQIRRRFARLTKLEKANIKRRRAKSVGSTWLEFHFGWTPLVKDIYDAIQVLQSPIPSLLCKAGGSMTEKASRPPSPSEIREGAGNHRNFQYSTLDVSCQLIADVSVSNPLLWRANQLGLINPATVVWDVVPWSFVIDWFVNVSDFLGGFTAFAGLTLDEPATTYFIRKEKFRTRTGYSSSVEIGHWSCLSVVRSVGISGPKLKIRPPKALSVTRGVTAVSLLLQQLRTIK